MRKIRRYFLTGLAVFLPIILTIYIIVSIFRFADNLLGRFINNYLERTLGFYIPGVGLVLSLIIVFLIGFFGTVFLGRKVFGFSERVFLKFPLVRQIYPSIKQIVNFIFSKEKPEFKKVVLIEYPRRGIWSVGFVTNEATEEMKKKTSEDLLNVFVPNSPGPITGYFMLVPKRDIVFLDLTVEEGLRLVISGGVVNP